MKIFSLHFVDWIIFFCFSKVGFQYCDADRADLGFVEWRWFEYENEIVRRKHSASWSIPWDEKGQQDR